MIILVVVNLRLRNLLKLFASTTRVPKEKKFFDLRSRYDLETISTYSIKLNIKNLKRGIALKYLVSFARMVTVTRGLVVNYSYSVIVHLPVLLVLYMRTS